HRESGKHGIQGGPIRHLRRQPRRSVGPLRRLGGSDAQVPQELAIILTACPRSLAVLPTSSAPKLFQELLRKVIGAGSVGTCSAMPTRVAAGSNATVTVSTG